MSFWEPNDTSSPPHLDAVHSKQPQWTASLHVPPLLLKCRKDISLSPYSPNCSPPTPFFPHSLLPLVWLPSYKYSCTNFESSCTYSWRQPSQLPLLPPHVRMRCYNLVPNTPQHNVHSHPPQQQSKFSRTVPRFPR